jgi:formylglycine-generating enzyme required for sulfatase activity
MRTPRFLSFMLLLASVVGGSAWGKTDDTTVLRDLGPGKKISICDFRLRGAAGGGIPPAFLGLGGAAVKDKTSAYSQELSAEFLHIYEEALSQARAFQLSPCEGLVCAKNGNPLTLGEAARENGLFACVKVESILGVGLGFKKKVNVKTTWQITGPSGWMLEIETEAKPEDTQGTFPDTTDPRLKPVFLQLARESARQFLDKLGSMMKTAGSQAEIRIVDPDELPVGTLLDPGTLQQPEPDCALNSDGKWEKRVALADGEEYTLVYIPNGSLPMGSAAAVDDDESHPQHQVTIGRAFWLGKFEVTQAQWQAVTGANPSKFKGDTLPVDSVSWNDCVKFLTTLNQRLGRDKEKAFRLPSEAEWEYACRAGTTTEYSFSSSWRNLAQYAWFEENSSKSTHPVGRLRPNPWGVYDVYGNVAEWCQDVWHSDYKGAPADGTVWGGDDEDRVHRGGRWDSSPSEVRSYRRDHQEAKEGDGTIGLRLALPALHPEAVRPAPAAPAAAVSEPAKSERPAANPSSPGQPAVTAKIEGTTVEAVSAAPPVTGHAETQPKTPSPDQGVLTPDGAKKPSEGVDLVISGTIKNFDQFLAYVVPDTYIQLVPIPTNGMIWTNFKFDDNGQLNASFVSDLGKLPVPKASAFSLEVPGVPPGRYFLAAQRTTMAWSKASEGPLFLTDKGAMFVVDVQAGAKEPLTINAGDLIVRIHP